jgi:hypothetical protein
MEKSKLIHKMTPMEFNTSLHQLELFKIAMLNLNIELLDRLLSDKYRYLGGKSKVETLEIFKGFFSQVLPEECLTTEVNFLISTRILAGCVALRFHNGYWPCPNSFIELGSAFVLKFDGGLISRIELSTEVCSEEGLEELCKLN